MSDTVTAVRDRSADARTPICPFDLHLDVVAGMVNLEIADDPHYDGMEIQRFDDPTHGRGLVVLLSRRGDGRVDVYHQPGVRVDPTAYRIGGGLGAWVGTTIDPARFEITDTGVAVDVAFTDAAGRAIDVRLDDRGRRRRRRGAFLAPMGAAVQHPTALPLVWMSRFDLLRRRRHAPSIRVDGREVHPGRLPMAWLHRRHLIKCAEDLCVVSVNTARHGPADPTGPDHASVTRTRTDGGLVAVTTTRDAHRARLRLTPPLPDLDAAPAGAAIRGTWTLDIDGHAGIVGGGWSAVKQTTTVDLVVDVTRPWRPTRLPPLMRAVTTAMPLFRTWPTTYRWTATVATGEDPTITSRWQRTDDQRGQAYRRFTGST